MDAELGDPNSPVPALCKTSAPMITGSGVVSDTREMVNMPAAAKMSPATLKAR